MHTDFLSLINNLSVFEPCDFYNLDNWIVSYIYDADTILIKNPDNSDQKICRLAYIDAPENSKESDIEVERLNNANQIYKTQFFFSQIAKTYTIDSLLNKLVRVRFINIDVYGRSIVEIYTQNMRSFQLDLVRLGFAVVYYQYLVPSYDSLRLLLVVNEYLAKEHKEGLWMSKYSIVYPWVFRSLKSKQKSMSESEISDFNSLTDRIFEEYESGQISYTTAQRRINSLVYD